MSKNETENNLKKAGEQNTGSHRNVKGSYHGAKYWSDEAYANFQDYQRKFIKESYSQILLRYSKKKDADILKRLDDVSDCGGSRADYIRQLIKEDSNIRTAEEAVRDLNCLNPTMEKSVLKERIKKLKGEND